MLIYCLQGTCSKGRYSFQDPSRKKKRCNGKHIGGKPEPTSKISAIKEDPKNTRQDTKLKIAKEAKNSVFPLFLPPLKRKTQIFTPYNLAL